MALITCSECRQQISNTARACPQCGAKVPHTKWWLWIPIGLVAAFLGFGMLANNSPDGAAKSKARGAIALCWDTQKKKSLGPAEQQQAARFCETMESDFQTKYGVRP